MSTKALSSRRRGSRPKPAHVSKPRITQKGRLKDIAGCMSDEDAREMRSIVASSCERIEPREW